MPKVQSGCRACFTSHRGARSKSLLCLEQWTGQTARRVLSRGDATQSGMRRCARRIYFTKGSPCVSVVGKKDRGLSALPSTIRCRCLERRMGTDDGELEYRPHSVLGWSKEYGEEYLLLFCI